MFSSILVLAVSTYCNPMSIPDTPIGICCRRVATGTPIAKTDRHWCGAPIKRQFRELADPSIFVENGRWHLYPSCGHMWTSDDEGGTWRHVPIQKETRYAPAVVRFRGKYYLVEAGGPLRVSDSPTGPFSDLGPFDAASFGSDPLMPRPAPDPAFFTEGDRLYLYWGCCNRPKCIWGAELDPENPLRAKAPARCLLEFDSEKYYWHCANEGAWVFKRGDTYYLVYSGFGTSSPLYNFVAMKSKSPLGPFVHQEKNPVLVTPSGFVKGTGHGCIFEDTHGDLWAAYTCVVCKYHPFERRIGFDRIEMDANGDLVPAKATDTPQWLPSSGKRGATGWIALPGACADTECTDGDIATFKAFETLPATVACDYGGPCALRAARVVWRDVGLDTMRGVVPGPFRYRIDRRENGKWTTWIDASQNDVDLQVDYREGPEATADATRLVILGAPAGITPGVMEFTVFGNPLPSAPAPAAEAVRTVASPAQLRAAIREMGPRGGTIELAGDDWLFTERDRDTLSFYISNHDQTPSHPVNLPFVGCTNLTVRGRGQTLRFSGATIGALILDSAGVRLENLKFDWTRPFLSELTVVGFRDGKTLVTVDPRLFPYRLENGKFISVGDGWTDRVERAFAFRGTTHEVVERSRDIPFDGTMSANADGSLTCDYDFRKVGRGLRVADVIALRPPCRPYPACVVYRSAGTVLEDVAIHTAWGMGVICQMSDGFTWRGTRTAEARTSGVFPPIGSGRVATLNADASHFSNVAGHVLVENCLFETMMDDAINVHSTCLAIVGTDGPNRIRCRYMHPQAIGFGVFNAGDTLRFIRGKTLENGPETRVTAVETHDEREVTLTLAGSLPEGYGPGDAVENATYQCAVTFRGNVVQNNRARGALFTTPHPVLVESNRFLHVSGSAILFAGDAQGWYESGACTDVTVRGNVFRDCLTSVFQFCNGILSSYPMIREPAAQKRHYHRNFRIKDNLFETFDVPLFYAQSTDDVVWRNNEVRRHGRYIGWKKPAFIRERCDNWNISEP